jgi:hypothetical protein
MSNLDFINGWDKGVLQKAVDNCHCNPYGDVSLANFLCFLSSRISDLFVSWTNLQPQCCADQKIFDLTHGQQCHITKSLDEQSNKKIFFKHICFFSLTNIFITATGTLLRLPGNNPVQKEGKTAVPFTDSNPPPFISPVFAYTGTSPTATGQIVTKPTNVAAVVAAAPTISSIPIPPKPSSSSSSIGVGHDLPAVPTPPHSSTPHLPSSAPPGASSPIPSSNSNSDPVSCGTPPKRRRNNGLDYHRHHRRLSHVPRHDDFFYDEY